MGRRRLIGTRGGSIAGSQFVWRDKLPTWNEAKCTCGTECVLVNFCPEGIIRYKNHVIYKEYAFDYDFCKGCGVCAAECIGGAVTLGDATEVEGQSSS